MIIKQKEEYRIVYRFVGISRIQNDFLRRTAFLLTLPFWFSFNCLAVIPPFLLICFYHNLETFKTLLDRWNSPMSDEELEEIINGR